MSKLFSYSVYEIILANRGFGDYWVKRFLDTSVVSVEKEKKKEKRRSNKDFLDVGED